MQDVLVEENVEREEKRINSLVWLAGQVLELSDGACSIGAGPYGFGTWTHPDSDIDVLFISDPPMWDENGIIPEGIDEYEIMLQGYDRQELVHRKWKTDGMEPYDLEKGLQENAGEQTRKVAEMLRMYGSRTMRVTRRECTEAFGILAEQELEGCTGQEKAMGEAEEGIDEALPGMTMV